MQRVHPPEHARSFSLPTRRRSFCPDDGYADPKANVVRLQPRQGFGLPDLFPSQSWQSVRTLARTLCVPLQLILWDRCRYDLLSFRSGRRDAPVSWQHRCNLGCDLLAFVIDCVLSFDCNLFESVRLVNG